MLSLRLALPDDIFTLHCLFVDYQDIYLDDYPRYNIELLKKIVLAGEIIVIVNESNYPVGMLWFSDKFLDLHCEVHILVRPESMKQVLRQNIIPLALSYAFRDVLKIKATPLGTQKGAIKLLNKYGFHHAGTLHAETRQNKKKVNMLMYELKKTRFKKLYGELLNGHIG